jgi:hypothetical protein
MTDYSLPLIVLRNLAKEYEEAVLKNKWDLAHQISSDMVEMALKLQDVTHAD